MKSFEIPAFYRSPFIAAIKQYRKKADNLKKDFSPTRLHFGPVEILLARHFGFCYGVENAIEIAFKTVNENPEKRIFLLSEMIHNPQVNLDLVAHGVRFIMDTHGKHYVEWDELNSDDIVIIPAFGTTLETEDILRERGIDPVKYNTTCPFVEKVWNRSAQIGKKGYSIVIHGKPKHEETRATFSHSAAHAPSVVIKDMDEAIRLAAYIRKEKSSDEFFQEFAGQYSPNFNPEKDLETLGVVNQTTMLASDTQAIADYLKQVLLSIDSQAPERFADTRDTLCYATLDNQGAVLGMLAEQADMALVVGGYNSSNTSHLVELCEEKLPTYYIENASKLLSDQQIQYFNLASHTEMISENYIPNTDTVKVLITAGASCPDAIVEAVIHQLVSFFPACRSIDEVMQDLATSS